MTRSWSASSAFRCSKADMITDMHCSFRLCTGDSPATGINKALLFYFVSDLSFNSGGIRGGEWPLFNGPPWSRANITANCNQ